MRSINVLGIDTEWNTIHQLLSIYFECDTFERTENEMASKSE